MIQRIIGIDFGTSTTVVKVKQYKDGQPVGDKLAVSYVDFDGNATCPTVIRMGNGHEWYGNAADINGNKDCVIYRNFKIDLESEDSAVREQAKDLTKKFFKYLNMKYGDQSRAFGDKPDEERTEVSYPAKWSGETREFMIDAAKEAGFPNVVGVDEPTAALRTVIVQYADLFEKDEKFISGGRINVLMIDCGAGTTDLALCRFSVVNKALANKIIGTWPASDGNIYFGGREMDKILSDLLKSYLKKYGANENQAKNVDMQINEVKAWKEQTVSPTLDMGPDCAISECIFIQNLARVISGGQDVPIDPITRAALEDLAHDYIQQYPVLVNGCIDFCRNMMDPDDNDIDHVILTGGHSQWYFIKDILTGADTAFGSVDLRNIQDHPEKVIKLSRPQETVATGMAYSLMPLRKLNPTAEQKKSDLLLIKERLVKSVFYQQNKWWYDEYNSFHEITSKLGKWFTNMPLSYRENTAIKLYVNISENETEVLVFNQPEKYVGIVTNALQVNNIEYSITRNPMYGYKIKIKKNSIENSMAAGCFSTEKISRHDLIYSFFNEVHLSYYGLKVLASTTWDKCGMHIDEAILFEFLETDGWGNKNAIIITDSGIYCIKRGSQKHYFTWDDFVKLRLKTCSYKLFSARTDVVAEDAGIDYPIASYLTSAFEAKNDLMVLQSLL